MFYGCGSITDVLFSIENATAGVKHGLPWHVGFQDADQRGKPPNQAFRIWQRPSLKEGKPEIGSKSLAWRRLTLAKQLYMHRNSMVQQLDRIEQILGISVDDSETGFLLQMCIRLYELG